jgi:hypothetical protein
MNVSSPSIGRTGRPADQVVASLAWNRIPPNIVGLIFIGCVLAFPHRNIDCFIIALSRDWSGGETVMQSEYDETIARWALERTEASAGVRASLMRAPIHGKARTILRRDGNERIVPYNLVLDRDETGPYLGGRETV